MEGGGGGGGGSKLVGRGVTEEGGGGAGAGGGPGVVSADMEGAGWEDWLENVSAGGTLV